jgi:hypothetical protein
MMAAVPSRKMRAVYFSQAPVRGENAFENSQTSCMQKGPPRLHHAEIVDYLLAAEVVREEAPVQKLELIHLGKG